MRRCRREVRALPGASPAAARPRQAHRRRAAPRPGYGGRSASSIALLKHASAGSALRAPPRSRTRAPRSRCSSGSKDRPRPRCSAALNASLTALSPSSCRPAFRQASTSNGVTGLPQPWPSSRDALPHVAYPFRHPTLLREQPPAIDVGPGTPELQSFFVDQPLQLLDLQAADPRWSGQGARARSSQPEPASAWQAGPAGKPARAPPGRELPPGRDIRGSR